MRTRPPVWLLGLFVMAACGGPADVEPPALGAVERFVWAGGQPIAFSTPPSTWKNSRYQNGGSEGVDFVKQGSGGEQILIAERLYVGNRDHCTLLRELRSGLNNHDRTSFTRAVSKARLYAQSPFNPNEKRSIETVNASLERARRAFLRDDPAIVQFELAAAIEQAAGIRFTIDETVERALFTAEGNTVYPRLEVQAPRRSELAGVRAVVVDFSFDSQKVPFVGRRTYVVKNNRLFEFGFQGRAENLPLFERVLETVTFPPGPCEH